MSFLQYLVFPFSCLYDGVMRIRNFLYDSGLLRSTRGELPTVVVGNLRVGGTGKTPMVEYLIRLLKKEYRLATLSRGYGRMSKGFLHASANSTVADLGDEPYQLYQNYGDEVGVFVCENRVEGIRKIRDLDATVDLVLLDDAYQHRALKPDFSILLTTWQQPFYTDYLLPAGRLREGRKQAKRADVLIVTKCPKDRTSQEEKRIQHQLKQYITPHTPIIFSWIEYGAPKALSGRARFNPEIIAFCGLAEPSLFIEYCANTFQLLESRSFSDHHSYSDQDLSELQGMAQKHTGKNPVFLTTEKDAVKLKSLLPKGYLGDFPIFVLPIEAHLNDLYEDRLINELQHTIFENDPASE